MKRLLISLAVPAASFCLIGAAAPSAALATCYSSTQSSQSYYDSAADGDAGLAPEIIGAVAVTDAACGIGIAPTLAQSGLISGDSSGIYINTDGNPSTGSSTFQGADKVVMTIGATGADYPPRVGTWNGSTFDFAPGPDLTPNSAGGGFIGTLDQLGISNPATLGMIFATEWSGIYDNYFDWAPEVGQPAFAFPVAFSTAAPAPVVQAPAPQTTTTAPSTPTNTAPAPDTAPRGCKVPRVKGVAALTAAGKLNRAGCKYRIKRVVSKVKKGRTVKTIPAAGRRTSSTVTLFVSKGKRRARSASAALYAQAESQMRAAVAFGANR